MKNMELSHAKKQESPVRNIITREMRKVTFDIDKNDETQDTDIASPLSVNFY